MPRNPRQHNIESSMAFTIITHVKDAFPKMRIVLMSTNLTYSHEVGCVPMQKMPHSHASTDKRSFCIRIVGSFTSENLHAKDGNKREKHAWPLRASHFHFPSESPWMELR